MQAQFSVSPATLTAIALRDDSPTPLILLQMARALYLLKAAHFIDFKVPEGNVRFNSNFCPVDQVCVGWGSLKESMQVITTAR
eukprot:COSAG01_NODE_3852_length_5629_cov_3.080108_11_plen_83_part_00